MPTTLSIDGVTYDVYKSVSDTDDYLGGRLGASAWTGESDADVKARALVTATRMLDRQKWAGAQNSSSQPLAFPRSGLTDREGESIAASTVPPDIETAQMELALALLQDESLQDRARGGSGREKRSIRTSDAAVEFWRPRDSGDAFPPIVQQLVGHYLWASNNAPTGAVFGDDVTSAFDTDGDDAFEVEEHLG